SVANRHGGAGPVVVTVTSPGRSDGKSFAASNLALAFADAGSRTLLIDGDVRRGRLHHVLNRHRRPGLTEILAGVVPLEQAIQGTSTRNLSFISCVVNSARSSWTQHRSVPARTASLWGQPPAACWSCSARA